MATLKKFNRSFTLSTLVRIHSEYGYRKVKEISECRQFIKIVGLEGSFKRGDIGTFTNKPNAPLFPTLDDLYFVSQCGKVYERGTRENMYVGHLNGRTLKRWVSDQSVD